jgi:hypothetical protein
LRYDGPDEYQTPVHALDPLLPYLPKGAHIWECACGKGNLVTALRGHGFDVTGTDVLGGHDFLSWKPDRWDVVVTNPPYRYKQQFLERAYSLGKPFAMLCPLTTLETEKRQRLFRTHGLELILMPRRVNFEGPTGNGSSAWFATAWFCWGLGLPQQIVFWAAANCP